jgi:hypothetical protein
VVGVFVQDLLGRHVGQRADPGVRARRIGGGERVGRRGPVAARNAAGLELGADRARSAGELGQAEVEDLRHAFRRADQVRRLDVAVDDAPGVRAAETAGDLDRDVERERERQRTALDPLLDRLAFVERHHDEGLAVALLDRVDRADVRMVEGRRRARLLQEAPARAGIGREVGREELQRDRPLEARVLGGVDLAHAAPASFPENPVVREGATDPVVHRAPAIAAPPASATG